ncbi:uncharacterized protein BP5553_01417 [Venustampulla echinocandica]|uniref:Enoyl reductase (ER) domain-containing protein n=1 Tax=Venustampulla echinocandica TaxID=2656787 RepID=A0A370U0Z7_9HELO|nr:uncharacterized protein BP5553_01417 [Venustampulla echinocandica]RDL41438.1 hypothetical protein BP5553_01417 [Venustampulla echinocandica]
MITEALVVAEPGSPFMYQEVHVDDNIRDDEVLVEMKATGVCHTDLNFRNEKTVPGLFPAVFGHEGAAIVVKTGSKVRTTSPGDHVLLTYTCCGNCKYCNNKDTSYCYDWERDNFGVGRADGSKSYAEKSGAAITSHFFGQSCFAKYAVVAANSVVKVDKDLPLDLLAPLGCGIMTGAGAMLNVVKPTAGSTVLIVGAGAVGLAALMAVKLAPSKPSKVIVVDIVSERLGLAKKYGATDVVNSKDHPDLKATLMAITEGKGVDGAIDTTGRPEIVGKLLESAAKKGVVVTVGVGSLTAEVSTNIFNTVNSGRTYVGCAMGSCYPQEFIPVLLTAWHDGKFPFTDLIKKYPAEDMEIAAKEVLDGSVVKAVLVWK